MRKTRIGVAFLLVIFLTLSVSISHADEVSQVRAAIVSKQAQWQAGETSMTQLSPAERRARLGLIKPSLPVGAEVMVMAEPPIMGAPPSLDWRSNGGNNFVTPVRNQGGCGSCWAFATTAALESLTLRVNNTPGVDLNLSEQVLVSCGSAGSCGGGYIGYASDYIRNTGLPLETCYPYTATDGSCGSACASYNTATYRIQNWTWVATTSPTVSAIRDALNSYGPLVTTLDVYDDFFSYSSGVYTHTTGDYAGGHAVLIVGYDDAGQYFIVKNSWSTGWGEAGYFKIAYSELGTVVNFGDYTIAYTGTACSYSISPTSQSFSASGGTGTVGVATQAGCTWSVSNGASWITVTAGSSGTGSGNVTYTVASNSGSSSRSAELTIAGQTVTVNESGQAPPACSYSISPISQSYSASGGNGTVNVATQAGCTWSVSNGASWITVTAGSSGTGSGNVTYTVAFNSGSSSRSAALTIAGQTVTVNESGQASPAIYNSHDFNADGKSDLIWQNQTTGQLYYWLMNGVALQSSGYLFGAQGVDTNWKIVGIGDFNADGKPDLIWQNQTTGQLYYWLMNGVALQSSGYLFGAQGVDTNWKIVGSGDFNADGKPDLIWQNQTTGQLYYWLMNGVALQSSDYLFGAQAVDTNWKIVGSGDFNADGKPDLIWQNQTTGQLYYWLMNGVALQSSDYLFGAQAVDTNWKIVGAFDLNGDGKPDLIWQNQTTGQLYYWLMNGVALQSGDYLFGAQAVSTNWKIVGK